LKENILLTKITNKYIQLKEHILLTLRLSND